MLDPRSSVQFSRSSSVVLALFVHVFTFEGCGVLFNVTKMMCRGIETCFLLVTDLGMQLLKHIVAALILWFLACTYLGGLCAFGVSVMVKIMTSSLLVNAATYFLRLVVRKVTHSSTETTVAMETVSLTFVAKRGNFLQALKTSQDR